MHSIRTKITAMTACVLVIVMITATVLGVTAIRNIGNREAEQILLLMCETGQKNLNHYFQSVEQSVEMVSAYVESDLDGMDDQHLQAHLNRVSDIFERLTYKTHGVLTYYYRIDPSISDTVKGFWYVNLDGKGFKKHDVTDISSYDTADTSQLVWFTVPKAGNASSAVWLPPYITDNLDKRVISYNAPVYYGGKFVGVIGIEIDFSDIVEEINNITLYENGYAFLNDEEGNVIYHPRMDVTTMDTQPKVPEGLLSDEKFIRYNFEGVEKDAVWLPLINGMRLNVTAPVEEINADWQNWIYTIILTFAFLLNVFLFVVMAFSGRITKPLRKLTHAAEQIDQGNYDCELDYDGQDEVGILTRTFKKVTANLKSYIGELNEMAYVDALTGVRNRMALRQDYDSFQGHEVAVMMLDLNDFKLINDTRGHEEGDRILRETGQLLADTFGENHCYRYGGDEFLVIVPDISAEEFHEKQESLRPRKPVIEGYDVVTFSVGSVHAMVNDPDKLRTLISSADEKMYETKRDIKRPPAFEHEMNQPVMKASEYTAAEMKAFLDEMSEKYDLARVVDPIECRIIEFGEDGRVSMNESCYGIWNAGQKCINCSSAMACRTGCHQEKAEHFQDNFYFIQSNPVKLRLSNGSLYDAVVELVNVEAESDHSVNDREAENIGTRAAHYLAHHDSLTNVLNSDAFYELGREMIKNSPDMSWVMITGNIMNFRLVNTLFGVTKGNELLVKTASMMREISEGARGLCGRLGGDHFALLIPGAKFREISLLNIARTLAETFNSGIYTCHIHFGVYEIDDSSIPVSVMCGRANSALRTIREDLTRTVAYFNNDILKEILLEQTVIGSFGEALKNREFQMYLQPLVVKDGRVIGAEALARWCRPDGTIIMPGDFIEILENAGLIHKLDLYMWELAVERLSMWKETGRRDLSISVNVSAKDFYSMDVFDVLTKLIDKYDVDSHMLRLEITETALLVEPEKSDSIVSRLRRKGFIVEIDDFGKDNSSLSLLKNMKADVLKIDMSFLQEIGEKERSRTILKSLISLADSLGMDVITEGVETSHQLQVLSEMGCNHFQGFYFSRPIPVNEFERKYGSE